MKVWKEVFLGSLVICGLVSCGAVRNSAPQSSTESTRISSFASFREVGKPQLVRIYFNPYTDSIKTVLNYYVNVEGQYSNGSYLPLDTSTIILTCDKGMLVGNEWVIPKKIDFEKVTFIAVARENPRLRDTITLWIQKWKDPRDAPDYEEPGEIRNRR